MVRWGRLSSMSAEEGTSNARLPLGKHHPSGVREANKMKSSRNSKLLAALEHYKSERWPQAEALLEELLQQNPDDSDSLFLLASLRMETDLDAAERLFLRCLALAPRHLFVRHYLAKLSQLRGDDESAITLLRQSIQINPNFAPTYNDLGTSLHQIGERDEAITFFDKAISVDPLYTMAHINRGLLLQEMRRPADADAAFREVLAVPPNCADAWHSCGVAHYQLAQYEQAIEACRRALALNPLHLGASGTLLQALGRVHRDDELKQASAEWAKRQGMVTTRCTGSRVEARILLLHAAEFCNVPTDFLFDRKRFETVRIHLGPSGNSDDATARISEREQFDIVFNAIGDADRGEPFFAAASELCERLNCPTLNAPHHISRTRRDALPSLLADIPGLVVPATRRVARANAPNYATEVGKHSAVLLRPIGSHGGDDLVRIDDPKRLAAELAASPSNEHYITDFWDYRSDDGYFRKYRLIFIDREVYPYHLAISKHWLVHYWRAEMTDWMKQEEQAFLADIRSVFRSTAELAINEVARRLDLDYGGMDCTILPDGRVLVFEANATMLVHLRESRGDFAYKHQHVPRIIDAMSDLVRRRIARPAGVMLTSANVRAA
jgi:tetratricopeptide (TPR) repeat protein/glutathione synthase/RimK-type ligase-like ATP-grasp enzyme